MKKFKISWLIFPLIPYFAWLRFQRYGKLNAAQMKYHKKTLGVLMLFCAMAALVGAIVYAAIVFKSDITGNWYALFFIEWVAGCLTVNLYAAKNWKREEYKVLSHEAIPFQLVPDARNAAVAHGKVPRLSLKMFRNNLKIEFHGTQFPLGFTNHGGNYWVKYGWRRPDCENESFYPRHLFIGGDLGAGMMNMTKYLLSRVNAGRTNRLAVMLLDQESGLNYEQFKNLPGVVVCMGENIRKAIQYLAENVVVMRNQVADIDASAPEVVLFTDFEITDALFGVSEVMKGMRDQFRSLVVLGKRNGVHLVCLGSPALNFKQTRKDFQNYFDLIQFHTTATYAVVVKNKTQFVKVKSPHPFNNNFLVQRDDEWLECKAPEIETAQLRRALAEHERAMMKGAKEMLEEFQTGLPPVKLWQRQAENEREASKFKTVIAGDMQHGKEEERLGERIS